MPGSIPEEEPFVKEMQARFKRAQAKELHGLAEETRALKVSVELPNPGGRLRVGMYANVIFDVPARW